jgi:hypothetical protein
MVSTAREPTRAAPSFSIARAEPIFSARALSEPDRAELKNGELKRGSDRAWTEPARVQPYLWEDNDGIDLAEGVWHRAPGCQPSKTIFYTTH